MTRVVCIAVHDVAPATWPRCKALLDMLDSLGTPPATLLVVPDFHRRGEVCGDRAFVEAIDTRLARGDEIALHGYTHLDESPAPHTPLGWLRRRHLTAGEGEFAVLADDQATVRLDAGLSMFGRLGWTARGFVAPAWLLGAGARTALRRTPIRWTSTHTHLEITATGRCISAPAISASVRSAWRRRISRRWLVAARTLTANAPIVRVALHPADAERADIANAWRELLRALLAEREPLTKSAALERA